MACSFHHTNEFHPSVSSLRILDKEDRQGYEVELLEADDGNAFGCDGCQEEDVPLCVKYCRESDTLWEMIKEFIQKVQPAKA